MKNLFLSVTFFALSFTALGKASKEYVYQVRIYHLKTNAQEERVERFLENAYLPALHRAGISKVGVFKPIVKDSLDRLIYVFVPFKKLEQVFELPQTLQRDAQYLSAGKDYLQAATADAPYTRIESILLRAFSGMPEPAVPVLTSPKEERVYELRSYESATEQISANKIAMFNDDEIAIFTNLEFHAVFYAQVISGPRMPNMMYMTTFNNRAERDKRWAAFGPEYKKISTLPKYSNTATKNTITFLVPANYSDI